MVGILRLGVREGGTRGSSYTPENGGLKKKNRRKTGGGRDLKGRAFRLSPSCTHPDIGKEPLWGKEGKRQGKDLRGLLRKTRQNEERGALLFLI